MPLLENTVLRGSLLAQQTIEDAFGRIEPPAGGQELNDPGTGISTLITTGIQIAFFIGGLLLLGYLFYGTFLWITSAGEEDKLQKARGTITQAIIGIILLIVALVIFVVVAGNILGIVQQDEAGNIYFDLPTIRDDSGTTDSPTPTP